MKKRRRNHYGWLTKPRDEMKRKMAKGLTSSKCHSSIRPIQYRYAVTLLTGWLPGLLREHAVQVLTVGQYLRPTENHLPVVRYWHPEEFEALERAALDLGFESVAAGPLVRSSYHADQNLPEGKRAESLIA